jgi:hypothetical protein
MSSPEELTQRIRQLEAENRRLRKAIGHIAEIALVTVLTDDSESPTPEASAKPLQ